MDKYEFNIKVEQIKKMAARSDYETAMKIADTIDWRRVRNVNILSMVATIYEKNEEYQEAKDILLLAFERAPIGKRLLFKLAELAIKEGSFKEAEDYYREFCDLAPDDPRQYILRYLILGAKGAPVEQLIHTLEQYCNIELDEKWLYELAELYAEANMGELCIMACDKIMLMFGLGKYVEKAMELKIQFAPLTKYQMDLVENRDKYEARLKAVEQEYHAGTRPREYDPEPDTKRETSPQSYMARQEAAFAMEPEEDYPEEEYPQEGYPEREYPEEGYPEGEYPEEGYPEEGYPKGEYPEEGYPEGDYPEEGYTEGEYPEEGYPKGEYPEEGYRGKGYSEKPYPVEGSREQRYSGTGFPSESYSREVYGANSYSEEYGQGGYPEGDPEEDEAGRVYRGRGHDDDGYPEEYDSGEGDYDPPYPMGRPGVEVEEPHARVTIEPEETGIHEVEKESDTQWTMDKNPRLMTDEAVRAGMHEAQVQANLAKEMSRLSDSRYRPETESAQTRVLTDIKDLGKEPAALESHHFMIESEYSSSGLNQAIELLKEIHRETGARNQAAKITGEKLNGKGVFAIADKLTGKDLIIEQAGTMTETTLQELNQLMARDETGMNVVLIDEAANLARIHKVYPGLAKRFEYVGKTEPKESVQAAAEDDKRPVRQVQVRKAGEALPKKVAGQPEAPAVKKAQKAPVNPVPKIAEKAAPAPQTKPAPVLKREEEAPAAAVYREETHKPKKAEPVKTVQPKKEAYPEPVEKAPVQAQTQPDEPEYDDGEEMDIDEFAQYACQYASDIDCSISGKSMLALYERIEIMEEDGVPLTRVNAEDLIEEAADKAENPSFFKKITGIFSSKYDRDGLLVLKEEHFI